MLKLGLIGAGVMGRRYLAACQSDPNAEIIAICEVNAERARSQAKKFDIDAVYSDTAAMLQSNKLDAAIVATPDFAHKGPVLECLDAGVHVLCEKPLSTSVDDALEIARAARKSRLQLMVNFGNRHRPLAIHLSRLLEDSAIGDIRYAYMCLNEKSIKTKTLPWADKTSALWFLISHTTDFVRWLMRNRVTDVYASNGKTSEQGGPVTTTAILNFVNGATAMMESTWDMPRSYQRDIDLRLSLHGSQGNIDIDMGHQGFVVSDQDRTATLQWDADAGGSPMDWWNRSCHYFTRCIASASDVHPNAVSGLETTIVLAALQRSLDTGQVVDIVATWPDAAGFLD